ncbi:hypothetical protein Vafri_20829 [Volvox africanus]|uniref:Uncharacterized protein n=1 Tax=Volvox africanus TaxID=51714 RepID=A0A8J4FB20_9CHLO|nr:hypothetical protein Vafri_20829 [Volvox africanus]
MATVCANSTSLSQWWPISQERHAQSRMTRRPSFHIWKGWALLRPRVNYPQSLLETSATSPLQVVAAVARHGGQSEVEPYPLHLLCVDDQSPSSSRSHSSDTRPGPGPGPRRAPSPQPSGSGGPSPGDGGGGGGDGSIQWRYWILMLAQHGGIYGTPAVLIAALTHIDVFGGLHWDVADVSLGLSLMIPVLVFDAVVGLPDWTTRQEDAAAVVRLFVEPELLQSGSATARPTSSETKQQPDVAPQPRHGGADDVAAATSGGGLTRSGAPVVAAGDSLDCEGSSPAPAPAPAPADDAASASLSVHIRAETYVVDGSSRIATSSSSSSDGADRGGGGREARWWAATQRLRMTFELMQVALRNNPGSGLTVLQEAVVILVAMTADEMLYRAVLLTLFGRWLRDRAYEAGAEEVLVLPGGLQLDTAAAANWAALGAGLALGVVVFGFKAWREANVSAPLMAIRAAEGHEEAEKKLRKQQLAGKYIPEEQLREEREKQARLQAAQTQVATFIGMQGALLWLLEGGRDLSQMAAAGSSFLLTGNLAAPLAGSVAVQVLISGYQRLALRRVVKQRSVKAIEAQQGRTELMQQQQQQQKD